MANVKLSERELMLVTDVDIILTKNNIITKVYQLFGELSNFYITAGNNFLEDEVKLISAKISKGENYEGLPWVMLDYPRYFKGDNCFSIRTFFWWGNFFSISLYVKGKFKQQLPIKNWPSILNNWYVCCNQNEWQHHFREDNYQLLNNYSIEKIQELSFYKFSKKIAISEWNSVESFMQKNYLHLLQINTMS